MKAISDSWQLHRDKNAQARFVLDPRAQLDNRRAFYAGAASIVAALQELNDAGLSLPFNVMHQLTKWQQEIDAVTPHAGELHHG